MMKLYICAIFCFLTSVLPAYAKPTPADAEKLYKAGKYTEAVLAYDSIMKSDGTSAQLLFNMGNAYVKSDKLGAAIGMLPAGARPRSLKLNH
jgi:thioredoxin-like negative regulator of GroEL